MPLHSDDQFLAAVAAALGESIGLIRRRGCHLEVTNDDPNPRKSGRASRTPMPDCDDPVDLATLGIDWDSDDDSRPYRRRRRHAATRRTSRRPRRAA